MRRDREKENRAVLHFPCSFNTELIISSSRQLYRLLPTDFLLWKRYETGMSEVGDPSNDTFNIRWTEKEAVQ